MRTRVATEQHKEMRVSAIIFELNSAFLGLRQLLATENPLQLMKNSLRFSLKALLVLKTIKFLSSHYGRRETA